MKQAYTVSLTLNNFQQLYLVVEPAVHQTALIKIEALPIFV